MASIEFPEDFDLSNSIIYFLAKVELALHQLQPFHNCKSLYFQVNACIFTHLEIPFSSGFASSKNRSVFVISYFLKIKIYSCLKI